MKKRQQKLLAQVGASTVLFASLNSTVQAMPAPSEGGWRSFDAATANAIAADSELKTTNIFRDHKTNVLYVSPSRSAVQSGIYRNVGTADCSLLKRQHLLTYDLPAPGTFKTVALKGTYGPFFDYQYGNYIQFRTYYDTLFQNATKLEEFRKSNAPLIAKKIELEAKDKSLSNRLGSIDSEMKAFDTRLTSLSNKLNLADTAEQIAEIKAEIAAVKKEKADSLPALKAEYKELMKQKLANEDLLIPVVAEYDSKKPLDFDAVSAEWNKVTSILTNLNSLALNTFNASDSALQKLNQKTVGTASASYSIWHEEEARLRQVVASSPILSGFSVTKLPIFNVVLKKSVAEDDVTTSVKSGTQNVQQTTSVEDYSTVGLPVGTGAESQTPVFTINDKDGKEVSVDAPKKELGTGASGTFQALVTQDAFCSGSNTAEIREYRENVDLSTSSQNTRYDIGFTYPLFKERAPSSEVIGQTVAFDYDYQLKADPIAITCNMDISKFQNYVRNAGSSGFLWWRKKWDNSQREQIQNSGMVCDVEINATNSDADKQKAYVDELRQGMMQEMAADFVLNYAKSYQVTTVDPNANITPDKANIGRTMGPAVAALCGTNLYCQIGSIILKTADEMFGSQKGKYSNTDVMTGTISRRYSERSFFTQSDSAKTVVSVKVN